MSGWVRYLKLQAKAKTGLGSGVIVWAVIALVGLVTTLVFAIFAAFIWLAERYDPLTAALILAGAFLLLTIIALVACLLAHRRAVTQAKLQLAERKNTPWLDPSHLGIGLQVARAVGWRRLIPLAAVALFAAGMAKEWAGRDKPPPQEDSEDDEKD